MCNCIQEMTDSIKEKYEKLPPPEKVAEWVDRGSFDNETIPLDGLGSRIAMSFSFQYRIKKTNGERAKNITTQKVSLRPNYCPFCGKAYA